MKDFFDEDYFERGLVTGKSCYMNYRWMPELTIPMAMTMIDFLEIERGQFILDFGCSKGFLVKAFRMLGRKALGVDCSRYALENCHPDVKNFLFPNLCFFSDSFDFCIAKDVFEHIPFEALKSTLKEINQKAKKMFVVVPLGDNGEYRIPAYHQDLSHIIAEDENWWMGLFENNGWVVQDFRFRIDGIKDNWSKYETGNGFFTLEKE